MRLTVTFTGLCLFVPDPSGRSMHVLLPATGGGHVHEHRAKLTFQGTEWDLRDRFLDLSGAGGKGTIGRMDEGAFDVREIVGRPVDARQLGRNPGHAVAARITLPLADGVKVGKTARYRYTFKKKDGTEVKRNPRLSNEFTWTVPDVSISEGAWQLLALRGNAAPDRLPALTGGEIVLKVSHLPDEDPGICEGDPVHHAHAYYDVYDPPAKGPLPRLDEKPPVTVKAAAGGSPFNCMGGVGGP
jgi:hypothetical protein